MEPYAFSLPIPFCDSKLVSSGREGVEVKAVARRFPGICPTCGQLSNDIHGYYERKVLDLPLVGQPVRLTLRMRRYRCLQKRCRRRTFAQQLPGFLAPYQRATRRLLNCLYHIAQALGGRAGARLAGKLAMPTSGDTLLRLVRRHPEPVLAEPVVLGVDDWGMRKGQRYGTILVDLEKRCVIDLLPDRRGATLAAWLASHPSVSVVTRDRSLEYAQAIAAGAPAAMQVADRWHLLKNMRETVERALDELYPRLRQQATATEAAPSKGEANLRPTFPRGSAEEKRRAERRARRVRRYELVRYLAAHGLSSRRLAKTLRMSRGTAVRYLRAESFPERSRRKQRSSILVYCSP